MRVSSRLLSSGWHRPRPRRGRTLLVRGVRAVSTVARTPCSAVTIPTPQPPPPRRAASFDAFGLVDPVPTWREPELATLTTGVVVRYGPTGFAHRVAQLLGTESKRPQPSPVRERVSTGTMPAPAIISAIDPA